MSSPFIFAGTDAKALIPYSGGIQLNNGQRLTRNPFDENYILNPNAEQELGVTAWLPCTATMSGINPTGALTYTAAGYTLSRSTMLSPERYSIRMSILGDWSAGKGFVSNQFTIKRKHFGKNLSIKLAAEIANGFNYINNTGTTASTFSVWVYHQYSTTYTWIPVSGGANMQFNASSLSTTASAMTEFNRLTFQTLGDETLGTGFYAVVILCTTSTSGVSGAVGIQVQDVYCGPQSVASGDVVVDEFGVNTAGTTAAAATATSATSINGGAGSTAELGAAFGAINASTITGSSSTSFVVKFSDTIRSTDNLEVQVQVGGSGPWAAVSNHPDIISSVQAGARYGISLYGGAPTDSVAIQFGNAGRTSTGAYSAAGADWNGIGTWRWRVRRRRVLKNTALSTDAGDGRVVAAAMGKSGNQAISATTITKITSFTTPVDTIGAWNATSNRYDIKSPGYYEVSAQAQFSTTGSNLIGYKINGAGNNFWLGADASGGVRTGGAQLIPQQLNIGDYIEFQAYSSVGNSVLANTTGDTAFTIKKLQGPSTIVPGAKIVARYNTIAGQSIASGGTHQVVNFGTKDTDPFGAVTTGASWKFTAPRADTYRVSTNIRYANGLTWTAGSYIFAMLWKNGVLVRGSDIAFFTTATPAQGPVALFSTTVDLLMGDYIDIRTGHGEASARTLVASDAHVWVSIESIAGTI